MSVKQTPATREMNMKRAIDITRIGHDTLDDEHEKIVKAVLQIQAFQALGQDETVKEKKVYQFQEENQHLIEPHIITLFTASATIEPVVNHYKQEMFRTEILGAGATPEMVLPDTPEPKTDEKPKKEEKRSLTERLFNKPKKRIVSSDDPYRISIPYYNDNMKKLERVERFAEYQAYGVELAEVVGYSGMMNYLRFHRTRFKFDVAYPLIRSHKAYIEIIKSQEKQIAGIVASAQSKEIFQTRNDFQIPQ